ncbi:vitamin B12-dependent ribonucleotide reductase [Lysinibacillus xylanilyticus]|uniref:vitamin B12-dependent ribonucleotide reductase n=1 Tax=Lysinibacillus xylanilyticus TaxID=582475 RepID=UPI003D082785
MKMSFDGVQRLIMLDRYSFKDTEKKTLKVGDLVVLTVKSDPQFPARGIGNVSEINGSNVTVLLEEVYRQYAETEGGHITVNVGAIDKPLEIYYEQIAKRNAKGLANVEATDELKAKWEAEFYEELASLNFVPAGRVLYGAGAEIDVTLFNCYVMPFPRDSREGIGQHRNEAMEIMSRGGGVGTNGSTLRPRNALARGVNGKSSGSVSWLNDIAQLTHLVQQGGSRRGAQMIMLNVWSPDIIEFIISKMQNPNVLRKIIAETKDDEIRELAQQKLKFEPLKDDERKVLEIAANVDCSGPKATIELEGQEVFSGTGIDNNKLQAKMYAERLLKDGGRYFVHNPEFLTGANISVGITKEFMEAVENDADFPLQFPNIENYSEYDMALYDDHWHEVGDVREWAKRGMEIKTYRTIKARELWNLINVCATYSAEPGVFFIDNANDMTNAKAYGQQVVATNPCGEQPLAPYSVCNLAAVNLANMVDKQTKQVDYEQLKHTVAVGVRMQDNTIDLTPYFLEANKKQAQGERRVGMGVMGLADMLIYCEVEYGSPEANEIVDKVFETIATTAYRTSIELAKEKGSFPFLEDVGDEYHQRKNSFINTGYMKNMPEDIRQGVIDHGIRNSHLLTVAPTGSTGSMVGVATGLEPYFAFKYYRSGRLGKFIEVNADIVQEYLDANPGATADNLPHWFKSSMELTPEQHVDVQCVIQRWVDSSLSKTVNAPKGYTVEQVAKVYEQLYKGGAKGGTVYVDGSRDSQVLTLEAEETDVTETKLIELDVIADVKSTQVKNVGNEIGDTCPICQIGTVIDAGGCHTCNNCQAQLKCGL